ncbi:hypothetical protein VZT92_001668 [Zoarces viviparus]|uniref:Dual specificity phosphatase catalytic domain-containing protein n=1 Tax=Zoarces viviparus TaxID=48416 RepID=A0AAW1G2W0_ZOAVI
MCDGRDSEQRTASNTDPEEEEECTCVTEDSKRTWTTPSLQELEEVLHSAPRSCRHGGEVWPNLYLGGPALTSGGVCVHWAVGVSRSAALVLLAYLMIHHQLSLLSSTRCVQQKRWIFPNRGFLRQLIALDRRLQGEGSNEAK